ncbi:transcription initiation factor IIB family protein [Halorussus salinisoli]|uniref:hypothetical protein n=1 Tax=Halorussus salinisoli TaxID=2558242 RepID=UPI0010C2051E|nr:hypothetical protein [Halorussus salinisoli]
MWCRSELAVSLIPQLASELGVPNHIRRRARRLAKESESTGITSGVDPAGFAAAHLYKAGCEAGRLMTQAEIAEAGNVATVTICTHRDVLNELVI